MKIIPVIDLKNGVVVHAKQGQRERYRPMQSLLCSSANIYDVIQAYLQLHDFNIFYIADLDAITQQGNHDDLIRKVLTAFPQHIFWVDKGYRLPIDAASYSPNYRPVLGSESYCNANISNMRLFGKNFVLSLDYKDNELLGAQDLFDNATLWPQNVIIMTLTRVGSYQGPDFDKLKFFSQRYPNKNIIAAGGIRNGIDLIKLRACGIEYALVASALHSGKLSTAELINIR